MSGVFFEARRFELTIPVKLSDSAAAVPHERDRNVHGAEEKPVRTLVIYREERAIGVGDQNALRNGTVRSQLPIS
jgi:hypothetical protein